MTNPSESTRDQILEAAKQLIIHNGFDGTSVAQICKHAGVSKGAFYYHFDSKQNLFMALLNQWLSSLDATFSVIQNTDESLLRQLENMTRASKIIFNEIDDPMSTFLAFWSKAYQDPAAWQDTIQPFRRYQVEFAGLLEKDFHTSSDTKAISAQDASHILVGLAVGILLQGLLFPDETNWQDILLKAVQLFTRGLERSPG